MDSQPIEVLKAADHDFLFKDPGGYLSQVPLNYMFFFSESVKMFFSFGDNSFGMFDM